MCHVIAWTERDEGLALFTPPDFRLKSASFRKGTNRSIYLSLRWEFEVMDANFDHIGLLALR